MGNVLFLRSEQMISQERPRIYVFQEFIILLKEPSTNSLSNPEKCSLSFQKSYLINHFNIQFPLRLQ